MAPDQVPPNNFPNTLANCSIRQYARGMTTSPETLRDELARDIFLSDNSSGPDKVILGDWADLEQTEAGASYAHRIANGLIAKGYGKPRTSTAVEYGVTYVSEAGDLHTDWGYSAPPEIDADGEVEVGKREWAKAYEIKSRPVTPETSIWQSDDCPWREGQQ